MAEAVFRNRRDAGRQLAERLVSEDVDNPVVFGIPRGGVIVALEVARRLGGLLDVIVPAKIRAPGQPELGLGAVAPDGSTYLDRQTMDLLGVNEEYLRREIEERRNEILRRTIAYRGDRDEVPLEGRTAILVDDGIATGGTAIAAARSLKSRKPAQLIGLPSQSSSRRSTRSFAFERPNPSLRWARGTKTSDR
jgi:putative phosphoribosyl transferase